MWKLNNTVLSNLWVKESKREIREYFERMKIKTRDGKMYGMPAKQYQEKFIALNIHIRQEKSSQAAAFQQVCNILRYSKEQIKPKGRYKHQSRN